MAGPISVVIPCYNAAAVVGEAIASVQAQTRPAQEILVVDDASTDRTAEIAARYPVELIRLDRNRGPSAARNEAIRRASGDYVAFLDADDLWDPEHLSIVAGLLDRFPAAAAAYSAVRFTGARSGKWGPSAPPGVPFDPIAGLVRQSDQPPQMAAVVPRQALLEVGGYDESYRYSQDYALWLRLARSGPFVCTDAVTASYRWHAGQLSTTHHLPQLVEAHLARCEAVARLREEQAPEYAAIVELARSVARRDVAMLWRENQREAARGVLQAAGKHAVLGWREQALWAGLWWISRLPGGRGMLEGLAAARRAVRGHQRP